MTKQIVSLLFISCCLCPGSVFANSGADVESWEREAALQASQSIDTQADRSELRQLIQAGDNTSAVRLLREVSGRSDLPAPARESLLLNLVNDLRQEPPGAVGAEVMSFFNEYQPRVMVAHEDHPRARVPLFNIRAAAAGVENGWIRQEATVQGAKLLSQGPHHLVNAYLVEHRLAGRAGLLDALASASPEQLTAVTELTGPQLAQNSNAFSLASEAAIRNQDVAAVEQLLSQGTGVGVARLLRASAEQFSREQASRVLDTAFNSGSVHTAALAMATLAPGLSADAQTTDLLVGALGHPELGASAALVLANGASPETLSELQALAGSDEKSLQTSRARLALQLRENQISGEPQQ